MIQQDKPQHAAAPQNGPHDLLSRLYREIGISAVAAALEANRRATGKPVEPAETPAAPRGEKAA